ncbi:hypothetical protein BH11PAT2_BH11PAT2_02420 [soil metagenome]
MQSKTPVVAGILVLLILIGLAVYFSSHPRTAVAPADTHTASSTATPTGNATVGATGQSQVVTYTDSGFAPATVGIAVGTTVTWVNNSTKKMWVASGNHPNHTLYDGTSGNEHCVSGTATSASVFDECTAIPSGGSYSFTFDKVGKWTYHNHVNASDTGEVDVTAGQSVTAAGVINVNATPN